MSDLLQQLGGLVLGSVPTMLLFLVTLAAYRFLVHTPLTKVLQERYAKTQGAIENAAAAVAAAEKKTTEYEERLRSARAEILRDLHEHLEMVRLESEVAVAQARADAQEKAVAAMASIEDSMQVARMELDGLVGELSTEILKRILPAGTASSQEQAG
ncbi:MAG TPA: ATP synthase F0 subunit B [Acidobacteriaceae bacterium]|nr:ATP synthase F0 subunit B [Acidobacteriaceae bacterium]